MSRQQWGHGYAAGVKAGIKAKTSFYDYVRTLYDGEDSPCGDFAFDIQRDEEFPRKPGKYIDDSTHRPVTYYGTILGHLRGFYDRDTSRAIEVFNELWHEWMEVTGKSVKPELWSVKSEQFDEETGEYKKLYAYGDEWELYRLEYGDIGYETPEEAKAEYGKEGSNG